MDSEIYKRMEALVREIAAIEWRSYTIPADTGLIHVPFGIVRKAKEIAAVIPNPEIVAAREVFAAWISEGGLTINRYASEDILAGKHDESDGVVIARTAYRAGRTARD